jgi:hypothetical protein
MYSIRLAFRCDRIEAEVTAFVTVSTAAAAVSFSIPFISSLP